MNETDTELDLFSFLQPEPDQAPAPEAADAGSSPEPPAAAPAAPAAPPEKRPLSHAELQQLALGFLVSLNPDAVAIQVPARFRKYQVTAAGFWRGEGRNYRNVERTAVVVLYERFEHCFSDCADRDARLAAIHALRSEKEELEADRNSARPTTSSANSAAGTTPPAGIPNTAN